MKTLEEVKAHLAKEGYNPEDMPRIEGFLFGSGLFEGDEFEIEYMSGTNSFFDFKDWFNGKDEKKSEIDWSEFGFGDFIHVQKGIDVNKLCIELQKEILEEISILLEQVSVQIKIKVANII